MYRKLVRLDPRNGGSFSEIDPIRLERAARVLQEYIQSNIRPQEDEFDIRGQVLPLCEGVLSDTLALPLIFADLPLKYPDREDMLPPGFNRPWVDFCIAATGSAPRASEPIARNGERYAEMVFEDPGDWPHVVKQYEEARRRERMGADYVPVSR